MKLACVIRSQLSPFLWDKRTRGILLKNFQYGTSQRWKKKQFFFFCKQQQSMIQHSDNCRRPLPQIRSPPSRDRRHQHKFMSLRQTRDIPVNESLLESTVTHFPYWYPMYSPACWRPRGCLGLGAGTWSGGACGRCCSLLKCFSHWGSHCSSHHLEGCWGLRRWG